MNLKGVRIGKVKREGDIFIFETTKDHKFLIARPGGFYQSDYAPRGEADGFCMYLRKHISGKIIEEVIQHKLDRVMTLVFKDSSLIFELFGKLNIIYLEDGKIMNSLRRSKVFSKGGSYTPTESIDFLSISEGEFKELVGGKTKRELARVLGIGNLVEEVYDKDPLKMREQLLILAKKSLDLKEVEESFKAEDLDRLSSDREAKLNAKRTKMQKSIDELKNKIISYEKKAGSYRGAGQMVISDLPRFEALLSEARKRGEKRIKVSSPKA